MTDKKDGPAPGSERAAADSKRPFATIDLKATEVRVTAGGSSTGGSSTTSTQTATAEKIVAAARAAQTVADPARPAAVTAKATAEAKRDEARQQPDTERRSAGENIELGSRPAMATGRTTSSASTPTPAAPRANGGLISHLGAGLIGGTLAMLGMPFVAPLLGLDVQRPSTSAVSGLSPDHVGRLTALEKQIRDRLAAPVTTVGPAKLAAEETARLDEMAKLIGTLAETQSKLTAENASIREEIAKHTALANAGDRLVKLEEQLNGMVAAASADPKNAGRLPQLAQLTGQVADLKNAVETRLTAMRRDMVQEIDARVAAGTEAAQAASQGTKRLDTEVAGLRSDAGRLTLRVDQLKATADTVEQSLTTSRDAATNFRTDVDERLKATARPADVAMAVAPVAAKVSTLEQSVQTVMRAEEDRRSNAERIVLSLELGNLKRAMDRGQKYANELAEVKRNAGGRISLEALERYQNQGIPTLVDLSRAFRPLANAILDAESDAADATVVDRLLNGAKNVVRVRKTAHSPDDTSTEATVARIETALKDSRLTDVIAEAKKLPPKSVVPAKDWLTQIEARHAVEAALVNIDAALKSSLGAGAGSDGQKGKK